jgi:hypothetical protein
MSAGPGTELPRLTRRQLLSGAARWSVAAALWAQAGGTTWAALAPVAGWSADDEGLLSAVGDTIVPETPDSPGAGAVGIGRFIAFTLANVSPAGAAAGVREALRQIEAAAKAAGGANFAALGREQREAVLTRYEAMPVRAGAANGFRTIKELTLLGYFTSEPGATQALRYAPVPGGYRGSVPLAPDERSWAT